MVRALIKIMLYEIKTTLRTGVSWITPAIFYIIIVCLFPFIVDDPSLLATLSPGIFWTATLLATILSINDMFQHDTEKGYIDLLLLSPYPMVLLTLAKTLSHWITHNLPLILITPLLGCLLHLTMQEQCALILTLLLGTPALSLIGSVGAALLVGIKGHNLLLPILIIPFYIPILIFGTSIILFTQHHEPVHAYYAMMGAFIALGLAFAPWLTASALRVGAHASC